MSILNREGSVLDHVGSRYVDIDTDELLDRIRTDLHPPQQQFFDNQNEIVGLSAGYGAGKTRALCSMAVKLAAMNIGFIGAVMEPTAPLIRDIWQTDFELFLEQYEIPLLLELVRFQNILCTSRKVTASYYAAASRTGLGLSV